MAHTYMNLTASQGQENAARNQDVIAAQMTSEQIAKVQQMAREWMEKNQ